MMPTKERVKFSLQKYLQLFGKFPLVPIESEAQLDKAISVINGLLDRERTIEEDAYLDVLGNLVEAYESVAYPAEPVEDKDILASILDSHGLTQAALARQSRIAESTISAVFAGTRQLTRAQIGRIVKTFGIPADVFEFSA